MFTLHFLIENIVGVLVGALVGVLVGDLVGDFVGDLVGDLVADIVGDGLPHYPEALASLWSDLAPSKWKPWGLQESSPRG